MNDVLGLDVDDASRCAHYHSPRDVVAIRMNCCGEWVACIRCHEACTDHAPEVWPRDAFDERAVRCGACGHEMTIQDYVDGPPACPSCDHAFNPGCKNHYPLYFEMDETQE